MEAMKAIIKYDLEDPDDTRAFHLACKAQDYQMFVWDFGQDVLRKFDRYGVPDNLATPAEIVCRIRDEYIRMFNEYKLEDPL